MHRETYLFCIGYNINTFNKGKDYWKICVSFAAKYISDAYTSIQYKQIIG